SRTASTRSVQEQRGPLRGREIEEEGWKNGSEMTTFSRDHSTTSLCSVAPEQAEARARLALSRAQRGISRVICPRTAPTRTLSSNTLTHLPTARVFRSLCQHCVRRGPYQLRDPSLSFGYYRPN